jgi:hypothetical protein
MELRPQAMSASMVVPVPLFVGQKTPQPALAQDEDPLVLQGDVGAGGQGPGPRTGRPTSRSSGTEGEVTTRSIPPSGE